MREHFERRFDEKSGLRKGYIAWNNDQQQYEANDDDFVLEAEGMNWSLSTFLKGQNEILILKNSVNALHVLNRVLKGAGRHAQDMQNRINNAQEYLCKGDCDTALHILSQNNTDEFHNTACTYLHELAFLNLEDSPGMRKLYWSTLGQIQFDENDQIIPPVMDDLACPVCSKDGSDIGY